MGSLTSHSIGVGGFLAGGFLGLRIYEMDMERGLWSRINRCFAGSWVMITLDLNSITNDDI